MRFEMGLADSTRKGGIPVASYFTDHSLRAHPAACAYQLLYKYNQKLLNCQIMVNAFGYQQVGGN